MYPPFGAASRSRLLISLLVAACASHAHAFKDPRKFVIVSNAAMGKILYGVLPAEGPVLQMNILIDTADGLIHPQGLAVDQKRGLLLVADSGLRKVVSYGLSSSKDTLSVDEQTPVVENIDTRWVTADGLGNIFFSDEAGNRIMKVSAADAEEGNTSGETLFDQAASASVSAPGGVITDNYFVYWTNKLNGNQVGTIAKALSASTPRGPQFATLSSNTPKSYGLCQAIGQIFYTDESFTLWGVEKSGGAPVAVTSNLTYPRGCVYDGLGRVLVADRGAGGVFSIPAPMVALAETSVERVADVEEAFGIAVFSAASRGASLGLASVLQARLLGLALAGALTSRLAQL